MRTIKQCNTKALCAMMLVGLGTPANAQLAFRGLGNLPGGGYASRALGLSADGRVVVGYSLAWSAIYTSINEAFLWTADQGMVGLGVPAAPGVFGSRATAASADGSVIVGYLGSGAVFRAFRWTEESGLVVLALPTGSIDSWAVDVSHDGSVIAGTLQLDNSKDRPGRWTSAGGWVELDVLPSFDSRAQVIAGGISADGQTIVGEEFFWTQSGGMIELPTIGGINPNMGKDISSDGLTVVGWDPPADFLAFRWQIGGGMITLGDLPGGQVDALAYAVSADGSIVVGESGTSNYQTNPNHGQEAFIWDFTNGIRLLQDVIEMQTGQDLTGWRLLRATGISDDGLTIVGDGINPYGDYEAWIFTNLPIPMPCPTDTDTNSFVNVTDLLALLTGWGPNSTGHIADFNDDGEVNVTDLLRLLAAWGACP